jgi:signal transduction histidine kinase
VATSTGLASARVQRGEVGSHLHRLAIAAAAILAIVAVVSVLTAARLALITRTSWAKLIAENEVTNAVLGLTFALLGALAVAERPRNWLSWLFVAEGLTNSLPVLGARWEAYAAHGQGAPLAGLAAWMASYTWIPGFLLALVILPLIYPTGRAQSVRWRLVVRLSVAYLIVVIVMLFTSQVPIADSYPGHRNPLAIFPWSYREGLIPVLAYLTLGFALLGLLALVLRFRAGDATLRAQVGWLFLALLFNLAVTRLETQLLGLIGAAFLAVALGLAVLRYRLYDVARLFNRAAVYGILTAAVVGVFAIFAGVLGSKINSNVLGAVLAAVVIALGAGPAREWLQRAIDRLMYGERQSPYAALAGLGRQLEQAPSDADALTAIAAAVAGALRLPYVAITTTPAVPISAGTPAAPAVVQAPGGVAGSPPARTVRLPLVHAGEEVGELTVGLRRGERELGRRDADLLADFTRLVAAAVTEVQLSTALRRSRERLILAREEERRRLRRELHDGVGPALAGLALSLGAAERAAVRSERAATTLLSSMQEDVQVLLADVRRISHDLRPAALDELGLVGALQQRCESLTDRSGGGPVVRIEAQQIPALPAAVEVAAYRIATEALANAVRHADAAHCTVRLLADGCLRMEIIDDGRGLPDRLVRGLGLDSMAERAAELGGSCVVESSNAGTTVRAELPLAVAG